MGFLKVDFLTPREHGLQESTKYGSQGPTETEAAVTEPDLGPLHYAS